MQISCVKTLITLGVAVAPNPFSQSSALAEEEDPYHLSHTALMTGFPVPPSSYGVVQTPFWYTVFNNWKDETISAFVNGAFPHDVLYADASMGGIPLPFANEASWESNIAFKRLTAAMLSLIVYGTQPALALKEARAPNIPMPDAPAAQESRYPESAATATAMAVTALHKKMSVSPQQMAAQLGGIDFAATPLGQSNAMAHYLGDGVRVTSGQFDILTFDKLLENGIAIVSQNTGPRRRAVLVFEKHTLTPEQGQLVKDGKSFKEVVAASSHEAPSLVYYRLNDPQDGETDRLVDLTTFTSVYAPQGTLEGAFAIRLDNPNDALTGLAYVNNPSGNTAALLDENGNPLPFSITNGAVVIYNDSAHQQLIKVNRVIFTDQWVESQHIIKKLEQSGNETFKKQNRKELWVPAPKTTCFEWKVCLTNEPTEVYWGPSTQAPVAFSLPKGSALKNEAFNGQGEGGWYKIKAVATGSRRANQDLYLARGVTTAKKTLDQYQTRPQSQASAPKATSTPASDTQSAKVPILIIGDSSLTLAKDRLYEVLLKRYKKEDIFLYSVCGSGVQNWLGEGQFTEEICGHKIIEPPGHALKRVHRLKDLIEHVKPKTVVMSLGTNNFASSKSTFQKDLIALHTIAKSRGARCLHFGPWKIERADVKRKLPSVYDSLNEVAKSTQCEVFDMRPVANASKEIGESDDKLHLKPGGAEEKKFVNYIEKIITEAP